MKGLYIHIPFCKHICSYCDFPKRIPFNEIEINRYLNKLILELTEHKFDDVDTIYIGGGTPNYLPNDKLEYLLKEIAKYNIKFKEYTIECNPELITEEQVKLFKKYNINRVSLGVQTINDEGIKLLNRHHNKFDVIKAVKLLKKYDINNISVDLIYGYFNETLLNLKEDLDFILNLDLTHISCYSLILEEKTMLDKLYRNNKLKEIDDDLVADMYTYIKERLKTNHFYQYEISNFAKKGYESIHNLKYWSKDEYIGIGLGATSYYKNTRITNSKKLSNYLNGNDKEIETISYDEEIKEYVIMSLRKVSGIDKNDFIKRFNKDINKIFNYDKMIKYNLLYEDDNILKLTDNGMLLANVVFEEFL